MPQSIDVKLELSATADFNLVVKDRRETVVAGTDAVYTVEAEWLTGYTDDIDLTVTGSPSGATAVFADNVLSSGESSTLTIGTTGVTPGTHTLTTIGGAGANEYEWLYGANASRLIDWTHCGVPGGIPNRTTIYTTLYQSSTVAQINAAIAACPSGQVVLLAAGTYPPTGSYSTSIDFAQKSSCTLRGAGPGQTIIKSTAAKIITCDDWYFRETDGVAIASGYTKGSMAITLSAAPPAAFVAGHLIHITQADSPDTFGTGVGVYRWTGSTGPYNLSTSRNLRFTSRITSVAGNTINLATPIPITFSATYSPQAYPLPYEASWNTISLCGVEEMTLDGVDSANEAVYFYSSDRCWTKDVEAKNCQGDYGFIFMGNCCQSEIRRCYTHDCTGYPSQDEGYSYFLFYGASSCLVIDNISYKTHALMMNGASANAIVYNYIGLNDFRDASWPVQSIDMNHGAGGMMNLIEGNMGARFQNDGYHGSSPYNFLMRNHIHGLKPGYTPTRRRLVDLCRGSYYHSVIGNIIGDASYSLLQYDYPYGGGSEMGAYILGFPSMDNTDMGTYTDVPFTNWAKSITVPDADVIGTLLRHGNYDYFDDATVWDGGISSHDIPDSLLYASKPSFFGSLTWPAIGPDVSGLVGDIPAKHRWDNYVISADLDDLFANEG